MSNEIHIHIHIDDHTSPAETEAAIRRSSAVRDVKRKRQSTSIAEKIKLVLDASPSKASV